MIKRYYFDSTVARILGWLLILECIMLLIPMVTGLAMGESDWKGFGIAAAASGTIGGAVAWLFRHSDVRLTRRDAYLLISLVWIIFSAVSMIPFMMSANPLGAASAYFESISGFTTTGATVISDVEAQSHAILLWRAMTQWIGGLGIVLFLIALLPALNDTGGIMMFNAEITGMTHDKLHPRIQQTAMSLWLVYLILTIVLMLMLMSGGMSAFDSLCQALSTLSTGGFCTRNAGISAWGSPFIAGVIAVFMMIGGINFILLYNAARGEWRQLWRNDVLRVYIIIVISFAAMMSISLGCQGRIDSFNTAVIAPFFHTTSAITSTGFSYSDFSGWGTLTTVLTILLMICGACAGSTTGAVKVDRMVAFFKNMRREMSLTIYPHHVNKCKVGGREVTASMMLRVSGFIGFYLILLIIGATVMACYGYGVTDSLFASASCVGNNGLGLGATGGGFGNLPDTVKWLFSMLMLIGRLEIFTVLALLLPSFWRKN